jgi:16S rRNA (uracil1498-N3)-methyltransferase
MHRFFIPPAAFQQHLVLLTGDVAFQMRRVLRLRLGERVILLDGEGGACEAVLIALGEEDARLQVARRWQAEGEPRTHITLCQAVLKGDHFAWALQKGVEAGVSAFAPIVCERNVVDDLAAVEGKRERWERVIREAAEQSGRGRLPELRPAQLFGQAAPPPSPGRGGAGGGVRLLLWEGERELRLRAALAGCNFASGVGIQLFVGPEGGFTEAEVDLARRCGIQPVSLGPRILRAETAGVIAAALVLYEANEI